MPRVIEVGRREELKAKMLKLLSTNGRMSIGDLGKNLGITKPSAYHLFLETIKEYDLRFVPEIDIEKIWKYEFIKLARMRTKKEILDEAIEEIPEAGFQEYMALFKFKGKQPSDDEIRKAMGNSYMPQFVARLGGEYSLIMYAVARRYNDINGFVIEFAKKLKGDTTSEMNRIMVDLGYFPLKKELLEKFNISETYLALLMGLNEDGRQEFISIAKKYKKEQQGMVYAMDRLKRTEILKRVTYYEGKQKSTVNAIIQMKVTNYTKFFAKRDNWFMDMIKSNEKRHNEYVYMCEVSNPHGVLIFASFADKARAKKAFNEMKRANAGVELKYIAMKNILVGQLGIRDFDMRYSDQYKTLERNKKVPRFVPKNIDNYYGSMRAGESGEMSLDGENPGLTQQ
ncbi:MAG: hypothetical protein KGH54_00345 [Candidatus Micrarchaeota archaeon]|nr:hypothetical protein [Candidatus Micrarchaeota archaeon]